MKNINKFIKCAILMSILFLLTIITPSVVKAEKYTGQTIVPSEYLSGIFVRKEKPNGYKKFIQARIIRRSEDNQHVYCLQPYEEVDNSPPEYDVIRSDYAQILGLSIDQWDRISLLAYYGYNYTDDGIDHTAKKWYAIAQVMIWRTVAPESDIYFTDTFNGNRIVKFEEEMQEMENLLIQHYKKPNFENVVLSMGDTIEIEDSNNVAEEFIIKNVSSNIEATLTNNKLKITTKDVGEAKIDFEKVGTKYTTPPIVYMSDHSQDVFYVGQYEPVMYNYTMKVAGGKIKITKVDNDTNKTNPQGEATLKGAIYNIYNSNNEIVSTLTIGDDNTATSDYLPYGNYTIRESKSSNGYLLDTNTYNATISSEITLNVTVKEKVIKGKIKIFKVDKDNNACTPQGAGTLVGAVFEIKNKDNNVVDTLTIGSDCTATSKDLPYGHYTISEKKASNGYIINANIFSSFINEVNVYEIKVLEEVITNDFLFYKFYGNQSTGFIYAEKDAVFDIINSNDKVVATIKTDENGFAKITLPYGCYTVKQVKGLDKYKMIGTFTINVNEETDSVQTNYIKNGDISARLKVLKIDSETKKVISLKGFKFKIKNLDTNEFICQTTNKVICEFETNEEGILITPLPLFAGDYELVEIVWF